MAEVTSCRQVGYGPWGGCGGRSPRAGDKASLTWLLGGRKLCRVSFSRLRCTWNLKIVGIASFILNLI